MSLHETLVSTSAAPVVFEVQSDDDKVEYRHTVDEDWPTPVAAILGEIRDGNEFDERGQRKVQRRTIQVLANTGDSRYGGVASVRQGGQFRIDGDDENIWTVDTDANSVRTTNTIHEVDLHRHAPRADGVLRGAMRRR